MQLNFEKTNGDWERAADAGHPGAQFHLGLMYATGEEIPLDLVLAHKWLNLAATRGSSDATTLLLVWFNNIDCCAPSSTAAATVAATAPLLQAFLC